MSLRAAGGQEALHAASALIGRIAAAWLKWTLRRRKSTASRREGRETLNRWLTVNREMAVRDAVAVAGAERLELGPQGKGRLR